MSKNNWQALVNRYANGRTVCNCGEAYYTPCGHGIDSNGIHRTDMLACKYGCSANQIFAKEEIAELVLIELTPNALVTGAHYEH